MPSAAVRRPFLAALVLSAALTFAGCGGEAGVTQAAGAEAAAPAGPVEGSLDWAIAGPWRRAEEVARDAHRHPKETLEFFGVESDDAVVEIMPGGGWYTAILGPWLRVGGGRLTAAHFDPSLSEGARRTVEAFTAAFIDQPEIYGAINLTVAGAGSPGIAPDGSADVVLTFRNVHTWMRGGYADKMFADAFRALKPGGVLGVVEHRLPSSREQDPLAASGYVLQSYVVQLAEQAGFVLEEASEINANPADRADHPLGVWMLPPNLRAPGPEDESFAGYDVETYRRIGESDRMTLRFRKPAAP